MLSLSLKQHHRGSVTDVCCANGFRFGSHLGDFYFGSGGCTFKLMGPLFLYFFQKFPNFSLQYYSLRLGFCFRA